MSALAIPYDYRYLHSSQMESGGTLRLATFSPSREAHPCFFEGDLVRPERSAAQLRALMRIVHARFHVPAAMLERILLQADPVVTCSDNRLRFEGFSGCCGVYARVDLYPDALRGESFGRGTTNVDFNPPMLAALASIRNTDRVSLRVGTNDVQLSKGDETIVEKKVKLPLRWLKGFVEVQACQSRMRLAHDITAVEARRFLQSLPRMKTSRRETFIMPSGHGLRISQIEGRGAVRVGGLERLRVLEDLSPRAQRLRVYADDVTGASAWELTFDDSRFHLVMSPEVWRGFSGEGQVLTSLASKTWENALARVRASLKWEAVVNSSDIAAQMDCSNQDVQTALAVLGSRGLVGFDLGESAYFHRELPFDLEQVERLHPRLLDARKLIAEQHLRPGLRTSSEIEIFVRSGDVEHRVRLADETDRCTCPWFSKHGDRRGPCKHILAARIFAEESEHE